MPRIPQYRIDPKWTALLHRLGFEAYLRKNHCRATQSRLDEQRDIRAYFR
jgi:hypothetical protein